MVKLQIQQPKKDGRIAHQISSGTDSTIEAGQLLGGGGKKSRWHPTIETTLLEYEGVKLRLMSDLPKSSCSHADKLLTHSLYSLYRAWMDVLTAMPFKMLLQLPG